MTFRSPSFPELLPKRWGDEIFVFNPNSGHTHALNAEAWRLVGKLYQHPMSEDQVLDYFGADTAQARTTVWESLGQLELFGLIERC